MKCELTKGNFDNWFCITSAESGRYMQRIGNADIEGDREEMAAIADAIENRKSAYFKRCAATHVTMFGELSGHYLLSSPRNTISPTKITVAEADELAASIRRVLAETPIDVPSNDYDDCEESP